MPRHTDGASAAAVPLFGGVSCVPIVGALYASAKVFVTHTCDSSSACSQEALHYLSSFSRVCCPTCYRYVQGRHHRAVGGAPQAYEGAQCRYLQYQTLIKHCRGLADTYAVVPSEDSHQSEYIAPCDARRGQTPPLSLAFHLLILLSIHQRFHWLSRLRSHHT